METENRRGCLYNLLGDLPERDRPVSVCVVSEEEHEHYILERLVLDLNGIEPVPAYFARPKEAAEPVPCILYNHAHGGNYALGKDEFIKGNDYMQKPPYAEVLANRGCSGLCIDAWAFGERSGRTESSIFKEMLWNGRVMWGMMVYDSLKAIDYFTYRTDVDPKSIGTLGLSMGSTMSWWVAALDTRVK
ncbi:MAG: dienelactone hydrolase family protein, partial [Armatimonadota bacterium]